MDWRSRGYQSRGLPASLDLLKARRADDARIRDDWRRASELEEAEMEAARRQAQQRQIDEARSRRERLHQERERRLGGIASSRRDYGPTHSRARSPSPGLGSEYRNPHTTAGPRAPGPPSSAYPPLRPRTVSPMGMARNVGPPPPTMTSRNLVPTQVPPSRPSNFPASRSRTTSLTRPGASPGLPPTTNLFSKSQILPPGPPRGRPPPRSTPMSAFTSRVQSRPPSRMTSQSSRDSAAIDESPPFAASPEGVPARPSTARPYSRTGYSSHKASVPTKVAGEDTIMRMFPPAPGPPSAPKGYTKPAGGERPRANSFGGRSAGYGGSGYKR